MSPLFRPERVGEVTLSPAPPSPIGDPNRIRLRIHKEEAELDSDDLDRLAEVIDEARQR